MNASTEEIFEAQGLEKFSMQFQYPHGILTFIISLLGILFNMLNMAVLINVKMRTPVNLLLSILSLVELLLFTIYIPYIILFNIAQSEDSPRYATNNINHARYMLFYADTSVLLHLSAIWLIVSTACFRFLLVQFPLVAAKWCTYRRASLAGFLTIAASIVATMPNFLQNEIGAFQYNFTNQTSYDMKFATEKYYRILPSAKFRESEWATNLNYWIFAILGKFLPCLLLLVFTVLLIRILHQADKRQKRLHGDRRRLSHSQPPLSSSSLRKKSLLPINGKSVASDRSNDYHQTTRMLLAVVASFLIVELPHGIFVLWAQFTDNMRVYNLLGDVIDLATLTAFSINFVLYNIMSRQYRQQFLALLMKLFVHSKAERDSVKRRLIKRRSSLRTMHTEQSELHPLAKLKSSEEKLNQEADSRGKNGSNV
ncbi:G-protein coupled receptor dmsr-1-like [Watersipora subatra]|uniref:G-protein coupled receptor dmsr-1-like n=1 Tax=Watersipora subatra TaxID=2589382 RepID=UPI00355B0AC3